MTRLEARNRFNSLPIEHRTTIIGNEIVTHIQWLEYEKRNAIKEHKRNLDRLNDQIKRLEKSLAELKD